MTPEEIFENLVEPFRQQLKPESFEFLLSRGKIFTKQITQNLAGVVGLSNVVRTPNRYYYQHDGVCLEDCEIRYYEGVMIGSTTCRGCENCTAQSNDKEEKRWIECKRIGDATKVS